MQLPWTNKLGVLAHTGAGLACGLVLCECVRQKERGWGDYIYNSMHAHVLTLTEDRGEGLAGSLG